jgi:mitochondrial import receptor subunit TOM20
MVLEMMRLDVSDSSSSASAADEAPPSTLSEDDGITSTRGPPSETSSQDWDRVTDPGSLTPPTA